MTPPPPCSATTITAAWSWCDRDDQAALAQSQASDLLGEVLVAAFPKSSRGRPKDQDGGSISDADWLPLLSRDHRRFGRWRVVHVGGAQAELEVTVYDIDRYESYADASQFGRPVDRPTQVWRWCDIEKYVVRLGHGDVVRNLPLSLSDDKLRCESCHATAQELGGRGMLRVCDNNYPSLNVTGATVDSSGRHFHCYRGLICAGCLGGQQQQPQGAANWFCNACQDHASAGYFDAWGEAVAPPSSSSGASQPGVAVTAKRFNTPGDAPAQRVRDLESAREARGARAAERSSRAGGDAAVASSSVLLSAFRERNFSQGDQQAVLGAISKLHNAGFVAAGASAAGAFPVPKDVRTLVVRGEGALAGDADVDARKERVDVSDLRQLQQEVVIAIGDLPMLIQSILDDKRIPEEHWFIGQPFREYYTASGEEVIGPEMWQGGQRMRRVAATAPPGAAIIYLNVWSDAVTAQSGDLYPLKITLANIASQSRCEDKGMRLAAMLPVVKIRKPRGSDRSERLMPYQQRVKSQVLCDSPAAALAELDRMASRPVVHRIGCMDVLVYYRLCLYISDKKEETDILGLKKAACPRCYGLTAARQKEHDEGRGQGLHGKHFAFMRTDAESRCSTAPRRTPGSVLGHQVRLALLAKSSVRGGRAAALKEAKALGIRLDVETQLNRLQHLIPWQSGGVYASIMTDCLHVLGLGVIRVFLKMVDIFICREAKRANPRKSYGDCRHEVEELLSEVPPFPGLISFRLGWWSEQLGKVSSSDYMAFFNQMLFVYVANTDLLPDAVKRGRLVRLHQKLHSVCSMVNTKQWVTKAEVAALDASLNGCAEGFRWLHTELGGATASGGSSVFASSSSSSSSSRGAGSGSDSDDGSDDEGGVTGGSEIPGDGFNIPKVHDFLCLAEVMAEVGWPRNACTSFFERTNKALKDADRRVRRDDRHGEHALDVLIRGGRLEMQHAEAASTAPGGGAKRQKRCPASGVGLLGDAGVWRDAAAAVKLDPAALEAAVRAELGVGAAAAVEICRGAVAYLAGADKAVVLSAGHSVLLSNAHQHKYARICCLVVGSGGEVSAVVNYYKANGSSGRHPECGLLWFRRSAAVHSVPLVDIMRREHIVAVAKGYTPAGPGSEDHAQFPLDPGVRDGGVRGAADIWSSCPRDLCSGRVRCPEGGPGAPAECAGCGLRFRWL